MNDQADRTDLRDNCPADAPRFALDLGGEGVGLYRQDPGAEWTEVARVALALGQVGQEMARLRGLAASLTGDAPVEVWLPDTPSGLNAEIPQTLIDEAGEFLTRHGFTPSHYTFREAPEGLDAAPVFLPPAAPAQRKRLGLAATVALAVLGAGGLWGLSGGSDAPEPRADIGGGQQIVLSAEAAPALHAAPGALDTPARAIRPAAARATSTPDAAPSAPPRPPGAVALSSAIATPVSPAVGATPAIPATEPAVADLSKAPASPPANAEDRTEVLASLGALRLLADPPRTETPQPELPNSIVDARATLPGAQEPATAPRSPASAPRAESTAETLPPTLDRALAATGFRPALLDSIAALALPEIADAPRTPREDTVPVRVAELQTLPVLPPSRPGTVAEVPTASPSTPAAPQPPAKEPVQVFSSKPEIVPPARPDSRPAVAVIPEEPAVAPPERPVAAEPAVPVFPRKPDIVPPARGGATVAATAPSPRAVEAAEIATAVAAATAAATAEAEDLAPSPNAIRQMSRPPARPGAMTAEEREREELMAALAPSDLALTRSDAPRARPDAVVVRVPAPAAAAAGAVATTPAPAPSVAAVRQPVPGTTVAPTPQEPPRAATAPRPAPQLPTSASVAKAATIDNAMPMRQLALVGVFGKSGSRHALVRLPNGRFVKVGPGDRVDGYQVAAIGENAVRMRRGGRDTVLEIPR
ncbi:hypothetical protein ACW9UR_03190 [Halovulum sp. GXIMD14794]